MPRTLPLLSVVLIAGLCPHSQAQTKPEKPHATGKTNPDLAPLDDLMTRFMAEHKIPGAALAVARKGKLVYARGFGWMDADRTKPVAPDTLFRIASISKPVTAVAIMKLVEDGQLQLDAPFWPILDPEGISPWEDDRAHSITIRQLLQHRGGWDRRKTFDPMLMSHWICRSLDVPAPADRLEILEFMREKHLQFDPGTGYAYSNFGYMLLGLVIEKLTGKSYEAYVQDAVLAPMGIRTMQIGRTLPGERHPKETDYFPKEGKVPDVFDPSGERLVPFPDGGFHLEAMDSHGGWIASAPDLVRFCSRMDLTGPSPLKRETLLEMYAHPEGKAPTSRKPTYFYGCGWNVREFARASASQPGTPLRIQRNVWHSGSLPGTATLMVGRHDGYAWAVLFNRRQPPKSPNLTGRIDPWIHKAVNSVTRWPKKNLFREMGYLR